MSKRNRHLAIVMTVCGCGLVASHPPQAAAAETHPTTTVLTASANSIEPGAAVTFTTSVMSNDRSGTPTGAVSLKDSGVLLAAGMAIDRGGHATFVSTTLSPGTHSLTAIYSGDDQYATGVSAPISVTVGNAAVSPSPALLPPTNSNAKAPPPASGFTGIILTLVGGCAVVVVTGALYVVWRRKQSDPGPA